MIRVAVQGEPGCFSHAAALEVFGEVKLVPCRDFRTLFDAVEGGRADRGAVPVENSLAGAVGQNLDLLVRRPLRATHETYVRIELCLVVPPGRNLTDIRSAASHPVALQQCHDFFERHPGIRAVAAYDTAGSIRDLMAAAGKDGEDAPFDAAIGPALAAEQYGGTILERGIEDHHRNFTRFLIVAPEDVPPPEEATSPGAATKTSIAFTVAHRPGSLHAALGIFAEHEVDLTRLESRPIPGHPWEYRFFADLRGGADGARREAVESLRATAREVHVLGTYEERTAPQETGGESG